MGVISIIDYGLNNLVSICRAVALFSDYKVISTRQAIESAEKVILPGVGAFGDGMAALESQGLTAAIREYATDGRPLLGICLGMQMLFESSDEFGFHKGLGLLKGRVEKIHGNSALELDLKVPHIAWSKLHIRDSSDKSILDGILGDASCYFVHSYSAVATNEDSLEATCQFGNQNLAASVRKGNIFGTQFHPEKSGQCGLTILKNYICM